jgi:hypothetical protein
VPLLLKTPTLYVTKVTVSAFFLLGAEHIVKARMARIVRAFFISAKDSKIIAIFAG